MITVPYIAWMTGSILLSTALFYIMSKRYGDEKTALRGAVLALILGALGAKLVYYFSQIHFMIIDGWLKSLFDMRVSTFSVFGGAMGAILGVYIASRRAGMKSIYLLNDFAPAGALMLALSRFGCIFLQENMTGWGRYISGSTFCFFPLAVVNEWQEYYWAVFMLETLCALVILVLSLVCFKKNRFIRTLFYLCLTQIFCQSLHADSIRWLFVRVQQLGCMLVLMAVLCVYTIRYHGTKWRYRPICAGLICAMVFVGVEFALDKSSWPVAIIYSVMILGLAGLAVVENIFRIKQKPVTEYSVG